MDDRGAPHWWSNVASWGVLLLAGVVGVAPLIPPGVQAETDPATFSTARAFEHVEVVAAEPRPMGSPASQRARNQISDQIRTLGLVPGFQTLEVPDYYTGSGETIQIVNVIARIQGSAPTGAVALVGHYDTVPATPGASDNASAVAVLLETVRVVLAGPTPRNDLIVLFTDAEEPAPRYGSAAFVAEHKWARDIAFVVNLEAIGTGGPSTLMETAGPSHWIVDNYAEAAPYPVAFSYLTATTNLIGGSNTDFAPFRDAGTYGVEVAYLHGSPIYHTERDTPDQVSLRSLHQHGSNTLALTRHLADVDFRSSPDDSGAVFFTVGRFTVVRYPTALSLPMVLLAGLVLAIAIWRRGAWRRFLSSLATTAATVLIAAVVSVGIWTVVAGWRNSMGMTEAYLYLAGLLAITAGIGAVVARLVDKRTGTGLEPAGVVTVWWLLALITTYGAPGMGYLFVWPALAGGLVLVWGSPEASEKWRGFVSFALVAGTTLVLLVPPIDTFFQLAQPRPGNPDSQLLLVIAIPVVLGAMVFELIRAFQPRSRPGLSGRY